MRKKIAIVVLLCVLIISIYINKRENIKQNYEKNENNVSASPVSNETAKVDTSTITNSSISIESSDEVRVIVKFKNKVDKTQVGKAKGKLKRDFKNVKALAMTIPKASLEILKSEPNVASVETDVIVRTNTQTQDWGIPRVHAPTSWSSGLTGNGIKVAIIDTGIANHDDLVIQGGVNFTTYTTSYSDDNGHGTHVAGIIGARNNSIGTVGVAPQSSLYAVKVLGSDGQGYLSDVIAGIDWAITNKMDIINLSLGSTTDSATLKAAVDNAYAQNILVVAAAGNSGTSDGLGNTVEYPAKYSSVIAVAATDSYDQRASFSSTGAEVEVSAPGVGIVSTYKDNNYVTMSGSSMATPYVVGSLALLKQLYPNLSASELRSDLQANIVDLGTLGKDTWYGFGLIQTYKNILTVTPAEQLQQTLQQHKLELIKGLQNRLPQ